MKLKTAASILLALFLGLLGLLVSTSVRLTWDWLPTPAASSPTRWAAAGLSVSIFFVGAFLLGFLFPRRWLVSALIALPILPLSAALAYWGNAIEIALALLIIIGSVGLALAGGFGGATLRNRLTLSHSHS